MDPRRLAIAVALLTSAAHAADSIPAEKLALIKSATVYIKLEIGNQVGSGSGFVIQVEDDGAYIATNHHVVRPRVPGLPLAGARITAVFYSGTRREQAVAATILAEDPERDLAILKATGIKEPPRPIEINRRPKLTETMQVYTFGFPFGEILALGKGHPAITIGKASISSLRLDDEGDLCLVQIDGALNPGNSGGPIVDVQGRLVGVAVATIKNASGIGLAIPPQELTRLLRGRLDKISFSTSKAQDGRTMVRVEVRLIDPLNRIESVALHYLPARSVKQRPGAADRLETLSSCRKLPLSIENQVAVGQFSLKPEIAELDLLYQAACIYSDKRKAATPSQVDTIRAHRVQVATRPELPAARVVPSRHEVAPGQATAGPQTRILGGAFDPVFQDEAPGGGVLVGLEIGLGEFFNSEVIRTVRPIFLGAEGKEVLGSQHGAENRRVVRVRAKPGYAVGGITVKAGLAVDGFSLTFMRMNNGKLQQDDSYESEWFGGQGGCPPTLLGGNGATVIGIIGKKNPRHCTGIGLLLQTTGQSDQDGRTARESPPKAVDTPPARPARPGEFLPGLVAELFNDLRFTERVKSRIDANIDFDWGDDAPDAAVNRDFFGIRWRGYLKPPKAGRYTFNAKSDNGLRLLVDGTPVFNKLTPHGQWQMSAEIELSATYHSVQLEFLDGVMTAWCRLHWQPPDALDSQAIPPACFFHDAEQEQMAGLGK